MSKVQLAVGQVWKDRERREVTITGNDNHEKYPFNGSTGESYTPGGSVYECYTSSEDLIELVQDENGWRPWKATADSQCPVDGKTRVHLRFSTGNATSLKHPSLAEEFVWRDIGPESIVAYKIVEEAPKAEEPLAPQPDADGWIPWVASENSQCPVGPEVKVVFRLKSGARSVGAFHAGVLTWDTRVANPISSYKIVVEEPVSQEPLAPQPDADGWIPWVASESSLCPVGWSALVEIKTEAGVKPARVASSVLWNTIPFKEHRVLAYKIVEETPKAEEPAARRHSHYFKDVSQIDEIDVYRVCDLFEVDDPSGATQHAIKKLLCAGKRGAKDRGKDYREAIDTLNRRLAMWEGE